MFIDYLTLIMINLVAGSALLAYYLWRGIDEPDQRPYAAAFFGVGLLSLITGLHLSFNWPLPGSYNVGYGDATTLFGVVFLATALALWNGWNLTPVAIYAFFAGIDAVIVGLRIFFSPAYQRTTDLGSLLRAGRSRLNRGSAIL